VVENFNDSKVNQCQNKHDTHHFPNGFVELEVEMIGRGMDMEWSCVKEWKHLAIGVELGSGFLEDLDFF